MFAMLRAFRQNKEQIRRILIDSPKGYQVPLSEVATIQMINGPGMIQMKMVCLPAMSM